MEKIEMKKKNVIIATPICNTSSGSEHAETSHSAETVDLNGLGHEDASVGKDFDVGSSGTMGYHQIT